jgi:hypothetical protein
MCVFIIQNVCKYQTGSAMELGCVKKFTVKSHLTCTDGAASGNMFLLNCLHLLTDVNVKSCVIIKNIF